VRTYDSPPRKQREGDPTPGQPFSRGIDWRQIVAQIETEGHLDVWASPEQLQGQPRILSLYQMVRKQSHHALRELTAEGYTITPRTTNTVVVDGVRSGDLILKVTKGAK
jgi:hypothetical protein